MERTKAILAVLLAIPLAGCVLRGKSASSAPASLPKPVAAPAPATPPAPPVLSIPQTRAQLPPPQPVPPDALTTAPPPEEDPPPAPVAPPKTPPRRQSTPAGGSRTETPLPAPAPTAEPGRSPVQEILPAEEQNRLREDANGARREIRQRLAQVAARVARQQKDRIDRIHSFVKQSEDAERRGDLRQASELAARALVLARELR